MALVDDAVFESIVFPDHFADLPDPGQLSKVIYPLDEIVLLSLLAVVAGTETFAAIAQFGKAKLSLLRRFRPSANATPDHDRLAEVFAALDPEPFQMVPPCRNLVGVNIKLLRQFVQRLFALYRCQDYLRLEGR